MLRNGILIVGFYIESSFASTLHLFVVFFLDVPKRQVLDGVAKTASLWRAINDQISFTQIDCIEPTATCEFVLVFVANNLETGGITLFGDIDRPTEKYFPTSEPPLTVGAEHMIFVFLPVMIP